MKITKDTAIQGLTAGIKVLSVVAGMASYSALIPPQYLPIALLTFNLASAFVEGATTVLTFIRGSNITLTPTKP